MPKSAKSATTTPNEIQIADRKPFCKLVLMIEKKTGPSAKLKTMPIGMPAKNAFREKIEFKSKLILEMKATQNEVDYLGN